MSPPDTAIPIHFERLFAEIPAFNDCHPQRRTPLHNQGEGYDVRAASEVNRRKTAGQAPCPRPPDWHALEALTFELRDSLVCARFV